MIGYLLFFAQATLQVGANDAYPQAAIMTAYADCLDRESLALEIADSDFDETFLAAKTACASEWMDLYEAGVEYYQNRDGFSGDASSASYDMTQRVAEGAKEEVRLNFLRVRAARKSR